MTTNGEEKNRDGRVTGREYDEIPNIGKENYAFLEVQAFPL